MNLTPWNKSDAAKPANPANVKAAAGSSPAAAPVKTISAPAHATVQNVQPAAPAKADPKPAAEPVAEAKKPESYAITGKSADGESFEVEPAKAAEPESEKKARKRKVKPTDMTAQEIEDLINDEKKRVKELIELKRKRAEEEAKKRAVEIRVARDGWAKEIGRALENSGYFKGDAKSKDKAVGAPVALILGAVIEHAGKWKSSPEDAAIKALVAKGEAELKRQGGDDK